GPVDGHDIGALMQTLGRAKAFGGPVIVHAITQKGRGFAAAEENVQDHFHAVGQIDSATGEPLSIASHTWTDVFADEIVNIAEANSNVVAITAAMLHPTGLGRLAAAHPERVIDVGIAEQHATTLAAGLAATGLHPVFAVYSTFLNRAFDQVLLDVALHKAGVTFVLDRSGVTGPDGASHNGMWDVSLLALVPGLHLAAPRDEETLRLALNEAVAITDAPSVVRYSKEKLPDPIPAIGVFEGLDMLAGSPDAEVLVVGLGQFARTGLEVADLLEKQGIPTRVVDPHWVLPLPDSLVRAAEQHRMVVVLEDNLSEGGVGDLLARRVSVPVSRYGIPKQFLEHANRAEIIADIGLQPGTIASEITARYLELEECLEPAKNPVTPI
ncbi:MAG: 1-deoxy-D-xylulose-5-phosphate synthase, partial [Propionibacteriales bacterium]